MLNFASLHSGMNSVKENLSKKYKYRYAFIMPVPVCSSIISVTNIFIIIIVWRQESSREGMNNASFFSQKNFTRNYKLQDAPKVSICKWEKPSVAYHRPSVIHDLLIAIHTAALSLQRNESTTNFSTGAVKRTPRKGHKSISQRHPCGLCLQPFLDMLGTSHSDVTIRFGKRISNSSRKLSWSESFQGPRRCLSFLTTDHTLEMAMCSHLHVTSKCQGWFMHPF